MSDELLINVTPMECRVALIENGTVNELFIERTVKRGLVGNIYKGKVVRVQPLRDGAFVMDKAICLNDSIIPHNPFAVLLPDYISRFSCHPGNMPVQQSQKVPR